MGKYFTDQYSLLHLATGIVSYFWNISFPVFILIHTLFEIIENTSVGMKIINEYITFWPGGKPASDTLINILGDTFYAALGWYIAKLASEYANKNKMYFD